MIVGDNMYLRKLEKADAVPMLEWMHDENVVANMATDFMRMTMENCNKFIENAIKNETIDVHRAICSDDNEYLGTVSLKNISKVDNNAEYAIVLKSSAMGTGASTFATNGILEIAFEKLELHKVYLYVKGSNIRAQRFYDKFGFRQEGRFVEHVRNSQGKYEDLIWLAICKREFNSRKIK